VCAVPHSGQRGRSPDGNGSSLLSCGVAGATTEHSPAAQASLLKASPSARTGPVGAPDLPRSAAGRLGGGRLGLNYRAKSLKSMICGQNALTLASDRSNRAKTLKSVGRFKAIVPSYTQSQTILAGRRSCNMARAPRRSLAPRSRHCCHKVTKARPRLCHSTACTQAPRRVPILAGQKLALVHVSGQKLAL